MEEAVIEKREEKKKSNSNRQKCKKCGSGQTYLRIKTEELVCRCCGFIEEL